MTDHNYTQFPIVQVWWLDHESMGGPDWQPIDEVLEWAEQDAAVGVSVGYLVYSDDNKIVLVDVIMDGHACGCANKILRQDIIKERILINGTGPTPGAAA